MELKLALYHNDRSICSQKVRICLAEIGLAFESCHIDLASGEQTSPDFLAINPNGVVPALKHGDDIITESTVICEYLAEVFGRGALIPDTPVETANMRAWLRYIDEVPSMAVRVPSYQHGLVGYFKNMTNSEFVKYIETKPIRKYFFRKMGRQGFNQADYDESIEQMIQCVSRLDQRLREGPWILGERYTLVDVCLAPLFQRLHDLGLQYIWTNGSPVVTDWFERLKLRPSFDTAFYPGAYFSSIDRNEMFGNGLERS